MLVVSEVLPGFSVVGWYGVMAPKGGRAVACMRAKGSAERLV